MSKLGQEAADCIYAAESAGINNAHMVLRGRAHCLGWAYGKAFRLAELAYDLGQAHAKKGMKDGSVS